jgi:hypothetical protein
MAARAHHGHLQISDAAPSRRPAPGHVDRRHHAEKWEKVKGERTPTRRSGRVGGSAAIMN